MKTFLITFLPMSFFVMTSLAQNYTNVKEIDEKEFYSLQKKFPQLLEKMEEYKCCFGEPELNDLTTPFYKTVEEFLTTNSPGFTMDSLQTRQFVYLLDELQYLLSKSIDLQAPILSTEFHRKSGFVWYDYLFLLENMNDVIADVSKDD